MSCGLWQVDCPERVCTTSYVSPASNGMGLAGRMAAGAGRLQANERCGRNPVTDIAVLLDDQRDAPALCLHGVEYMSSTFRSRTDEAQHSLASLGVP